MNRFFLPGIFLLVLFSACTIYKEYPIEVYKPGKVVVPPSAQNVALIYRNFKFSNDTLQHFYKKESRLIRAGKDPANLDSMMVYSCLNELAKGLKSNNAFQEVQIFPYHLFTRHTGEHLPEISPELIQKIAGNTGSDLLVSLEMFSYFFSTYPGTFERPEANEAITAAVWGIYDTNRQELLQRKTIIDTIFWDGYDNQGNYQKGTKRPPRLKAMQIASAMAGKNFAKHFYASWETVDRIYTIPPLPDFSEAAYYFEEGKWDQAIALWKKYAAREKGKLAINARYNLALAYEMKDDISLAEKWLNAANELARSYSNKDDLKMIRAYQKALNIRKKEIKQLEDQ
jgi:hypothetical protein